jgi:small-conductance mechanosensitive channel/CRP-like cAMP-binding protein
MDGLSWLDSWGAIAAIVATVLVTAMLVNRYAPDHRAKNKRMLRLVALFLFASGASKVIAHFFPNPTLSSFAHATAEILGFFTLVGAGGVMLFELALPAARLRLPTIVSDLAMGVAYVFSALVVMQRFGFHPTSILATGAVLTGILGLSLQATLGNVIGGVALQLDDSIRVGDWVQLENGRQGLVREIRWRHTVIETRDWGTMIVPNALLLASSFMILGKRAGKPVQHRMWVYFNVDFRFAPDHVIEVVEQALRATAIENIATEPAPQCICFDFARDNRDSMAYYAVRYWLTDLAKDDPTNSAVRVRIYAALKRAQIPLAVPAMQVWVEQDSEERRARKVQRELDKRRAALKTVPFLAPLHEEEIDSLAGGLHYAPFAAGEIITREGAVAHWLYVIVEGKAEVSVSGVGAKGGKAKKRTVASIQGPDVVGEMGLLTGAPRAASVTAVTDVECYRLDKASFHRVLEHRPALATEITALMAARQVELRNLVSGADSGAKSGVDDEKVKLLGAVRRFFGLDEKE